MRQSPFSFRRATPSSIAHRTLPSLLVGAAVLMSSSAAYAVKSGELYTADSYGYGRIEARIHFAAGDGVVSAFFLWKDGSEMEDVFWNELDFEKIGADCQLASNAFYGLPERVNTEDHEVQIDPCGTFHTYTYEWTPEYIAWFVDDIELRRETGEAVQAFAENAADGMQIRFNIWPGDATFGGNFDPAILPVHQYINWVQYSSYVNGIFQLEWREDFAGSTRPSGWNVGSWDSPKGLSTHSGANVNFADGYAIVSLTADEATGPAGAIPMDPEGPGPLEVPAATAPTTTTTTTGTGAAPSAGTTGMPVQPMPAGMSSSDADSGGCRLAAGPRDGSASLPWLLLGAAWGATRLRRRHTRS